MSKVNATETSYELHTLGWKAFQDLCATIMRDVLGQTVENFLPSGDGGRDGAFFGKWDNISNGVEGSFVVQCKHTSIAGKTITLSMLSEEINKAENLASKKLADNYILLTNCALTGKSEEKIRKAFLNISGIKWLGIYDNTWITSQIKESSKLRMLVPRVYGLGDLSQILDHRAYNQATEILDSMGSDLAKFVTTSVHNKAANAIIKEGFVLLLGEPASGKSTIAATLSLGAIDMWKCQTMKLIDPLDFQKHWNPREKRQFFWFDDVFGSTQYQRDLVLSWNRVFPHISAAISSGTRIVFTSRNYIYQAAINDLKFTAFPLLKKSQVVINVHDLLISEKQQMIYNHIKLGDQSVEFKQKIKPMLEDISSSSYFLPEIARRLGTQMFTKDLFLHKTFINNFVEHPIDYLVDMLSGLDIDSKAAIGLIFMNGGSISHPLTLSNEERDSLYSMGSTEKKTKDALVSLDGSLLHLIKSHPSQWIYKHPTIGDAYSRWLSSNSEMIDIYIKGVTPVKLMREVVCGDVDIKGAIIIPHSRYDEIISKLAGNADSSLFSFLASRCDVDFLKKILSVRPTLIGSALIFGSYLRYYSEVSFITKLNKHKLLPECARMKFISIVSDLAV
ncbi:MAG: restriction endonuclease, partial [Candidatus Edwardsbacteria bacterium]|nr:restriction endonuclease [Candidatus Edwardsbacteria bacterium]